MDKNTWNSWYHKIMDDLGFNKHNDLKTTELLNNLLKEHPKKSNLNDLKNLIENKEVYVFGAGPSINKHIEKFKKLQKNNPNNINKNNNYVIISADGTTKALLEENIYPDVIITDLDGHMDEIIQSSNNGAIIIVHAHGDNEENVIMYVNQLSNIIGSSQVPDVSNFENILNYGGFTDGDRCIFLANEFKPSKIVLCGMDFGDKITNYSRPNLKNKIEQADEIKIKKLKYAEELTNWLIKNGNCTIEFIK
ncbi:6-hydroxymethylpterin diphosphokinase MptE-like protein [Methanococcus voltae]|uniref:6-hydroxymethyl-7,8-dihydropterin pyrophosphokinase n=1 Tax=Methanococcus voltae (strain ATCC BAA-1334 / A3) TaxID=456320 RepID=D7DRE3_METV3|nr:6-hydroxymethylpterin diphosphokinase MptE-like protein [Methanococcus voltae]MCS3901080.1 putative Rossmann fold enzyme [Methanococcus voltae]